MARIITFLLFLLLAACAGRAVNNAADRGTVLAAHTEPVCMLKSPLPSSIPYATVGEINSSAQFYGSAEPLIPLMADQARKMGADVVINMRTGHKVGMLAWARPYGLGTGVKLAKSVDFNCVAAGGELR